MKKTASYLIATFIFNTAIASVLTMFLSGPTFWQQFVISQCIGLSVLAINLLVITYVKSGIRRWAVLAVSLPGSVATGITLASAITGVGSWSEEHIWQPIVLGLFFGLIGAIAVLLAERIETEVKQRQLIKSESEKREIE